MKSNQLQAMSLSSSQETNDVDGFRYANSMNPGKGIEGKRLVGKNVEHERLHSRKSNNEKQSQSYTEEIAARSMEHPGDVDEGCSPGFWKDSIMNTPALLSHVYSKLGEEKYQPSNWDNDFRAGIVLL
jgi:hypothetical protein